MAVGLESPILRYLLSTAQADATNAPVNSMGTGVQSNAQRRAAGNKFQTVTERQKSKNAKRVGPGKAKKKGKMRGAVAKTPPKPVGPPSSTPGPDNPEVGINPPQLPVPPNEENLGLA